MRDHPRVCGEKRAAHSTLSAALGSPPRMRGKEGGADPGRTEPGITPAYAGKRTPKSYKPPFWRDHPRVCGEKCELVFSLVTLLGSPPRMRGKAPGQLVGQMIIGITPAYAGKRRRVCTGLLRPRDHPRVCGEKASRMARAFWFWGSPPRMRGKGADLGRGRRALGITPAYAGKRPAS